MRELLWWMRARYAYGTARELYWVFPGSSPAMLTEAGDTFLTEAGDRLALE